MYILAMDGWWKERGKSGRKKGAGLTLELSRSLNEKMLLARRHSLIKISIISSGSNDSQKSASRPSE